EATRADAAGAAGLFLASEEVTEAEFEVFAESVGRLVGNLGLAYIPVVPESELSAFLEGVRESDPAYSMFALNADGEKSPAGPDQVHYPVLYLVPGPGTDLDLRGFDAGTDPVWVEALERAAENGGVSVSPLTQLFGRPDLWGFLMVAPIAESGQVTGFTVSLSRVDALVEGKLAASLSEVVVWSVSDITATPARPASPDPLRRTETLEVGDRLWRVEVIPTEAARNALTGGPAWPNVVLGLLLTGAAAVSAHIGVGALRSREENAELRRLAEEKDQFMAAISHELRTPLTVVVGMAEILEESTLGSDPEIREYVTLLRQQGTELARLVDNLLLLGRLDAEVLPMRPETVDLAWEVERIIREVDAPPHVEVSLQGAADVWADPLRLRHVIRHLHTNAVRHAHHRVAYQIEHGLREVRLAVVDDGPGVAGAELPSLFTAASGKKDTPGGPTSLGLGLRVSKRLAIALGGDLTYRRTGSETVFELRLPKTRIGEATPSDRRDNARRERNHVGT
ncbi:MAG: CHASE domain-containing protein, partial [Acidimicrobiia bacterium]